jgi:hypothetical protein
MSHEQLGRMLDRMQSEASQAQADSLAAEACLHAYRGALRDQRAHLERLQAQIAAVRDQVLALDRWHDDGGRCWRTVTSRPRSTAGARKASRSA